MNTTELEKIVEECKGSSLFYFGKWLARRDTPKLGIELKFFIKSACLEYAAAETKRADEAEAITSFAMDKDYYEKYQRFCAELEVTKIERNTLQLRVTELEKAAKDSEPCHVCGSKPGMPTPAKAICSRCGNTL